MAIQPISPKASANDTNIFAGILSGSNAELISGLNNAVQRGRDADRTALAQEQAFLTERSNNKAEKRADSLQRSNAAKDLLSIGRQLANDRVAETQFNQRFGLDQDRQELNEDRFDLEREVAESGTFQQQQSADAARTRNEISQASLDETKRRNSATEALASLQSEANLGLTNARREQVEGETVLDSLEVDRARTTNDALEALIQSNDPQERARLAENVRFLRDDRSASTTTTRKPTPLRQKERLDEELKLAKSEDDLARVRKGETKDSNGKDLKDEATLLREIDIRKRALGGGDQTVDDSDPLSLLEGL